jgi:hypothetical protein
MNKVFKIVSCSILLNRKDEYLMFNVQKLNRKDEYLIFNVQKKHFKFGEGTEKIIPLIFKVS